MGIPLRVDSQDRVRNLIMIIKFLKRFKNITIFVLEAGVKPLIEDIDGVTKIFVEDHNPLFHKNKYIRKLFENTVTKFVGIWDCDVVISRQMIEDAMKQLRLEQADMSIPYNGVFRNVDGLLLNDFLKNGDVNLLLENQNKTTVFFGHHSCGGAFIVNKERHFDAGGENLKFTSWGPEDLERYKRWEICGMRIHRGSEPMFHLHHQRGTNSMYANEETWQRLNIELIETCRSTKEELISRISRENM